LVAGAETKIVVINEFTIRSPARLRPTSSWMSVEIQASFRAVPRLVEQAKISIEKEACLGLLRTVHLEWTYETPTILVLKKVWYRIALHISQSRCQ
jgi:hypothetical protein